MSKQVLNYGVLDSTLLSELIDVENCESAECVEYMIREYEVIYHNLAIDFLAQHDPSLVDALSEADDMGYALSDLNSEVLATLLAQRIMFDELAEIENDLFIEVRHFDELDEDEQKDVIETYGDEAKDYYYDDDLNTYEL